MSAWVTAQMGLPRAPWGSGLAGPRGVGVGRLAAQIPAECAGTRYPSRMWDGFRIPPLRWPRRVRASMAAATLAGLLVTGCAGSPPRPTPRPIPPLRTPLPTTIPPGEGAIIGGISFCAGVVPKVYPRFVAGTVVVLRGSMSSVAVSPGVTRTVLPQVEVASEKVGTNQEFRFVLAPASYVLSAGAPWAPVAVRVQSGKTAWRTIPGLCI